MISEQLCVLLEVTTKQRLWGFFQWYWTSIEWPTLLSAVIFEYEDMRFSSDSDFENTRYDVMSDNIKRQRVQQSIDCGCAVYWGKWRQKTFRVTTWKYLRSPLYTVRANSRGRGCESAPPDNLSDGVAHPLNTKHNKKEEKKREEKRR